MCRIVEAGPGDFMHMHAFLTLLYRTSMYCTVYLFAVV